MKKSLNFWNFVNIKVPKSKLDHLGFYCISDFFDRTIRKVRNWNQGWVLNGGTPCMSFLCYELIIFDLNPDLLSRSIRTFAFFSSWIMWVRVLECSDTTKCAVLFLLVVVTKCTNNCWKLFHAAHLPTKSRQKSKVSFSLFNTENEFT